MSEQYTYAVARIRALEVSLFSNAVIDQLIACQDYGQCLQFLEERGWGDSETSGNAEAILTREEEKISQSIAKQETSPKPAGISTLVGCKRLNAAICNQGKQQQQRDRNPWMDGEPGKC